MTPEPYVNVSAWQPNAVIEIRVTGETDPTTIIQSVLDRMNFTIDDDGYLRLNM